MPLSHQAEAILLLTVRLGQADHGTPKPLSNSEWGRFAAWLKAHDADPADLLQSDRTSLLSGWSDRSINLTRIEFLLGRAGALALSLERWERAGLWVVARSDADYPPRLKERLQNNAPPSLFGCGDRRLLTRSGIAIVGSRNASEEQLNTASVLGAAAARQGYSVISGGARGVDEAAISGALAVEGSAVGIVPNDLLRISTSPKYRRPISTGVLCFVSPFNPEAGFTVGNAMGRNRYIYCLADAAIVVAVDRGRGGTWSGAVENLAHQWVPLWVQAEHELDDGAGALVDGGARSLPRGTLDFGRMLAAATGSPAVAEGAALESSTSTQRVESRPVVRNPADGPNPVRVTKDPSMYEEFLQEFRRLPSEPRNARGLAQVMHRKPSDLGPLLKAAVADGHVTKLSRPVRYVWTGEVGHQDSLFEGSTLLGPPAGSA